MGLKLTGVSKAFGSFQAIKDLSSEQVVAPGKRRD
jgi:hypothetical protein